MKRLAILWLLALAPLVHAHGPYRERVGTLGALELHKAYVDGILVVDPVRFEARRGEELVAKTEYGRDVAIFCRNAATCLVFQSQGPWTVFPDAWRLAGTRLEPASPWLGIPGALLLFSQHLAGYAVAIAIPLLPPLIVFRATRRRGRRVGGAILGVLFLLACLAAVSAHTYLSVSVFLLLIATAIAAANLTAVKEYLRPADVNSA